MLDNFQNLASWRLLSSNISRLRSFNTFHKTNPRARIQALLTIRFLNHLKWNNSRDYLRELGEISLCLNKISSLFHRSSVKSHLLTIFSNDSSSSWQRGQHESLEKSFVLTQSHVISLLGPINHKNLDTLGQILFPQMCLHRGLGSFSYEFDRRVSLFDRRWSKFAITSSKLVSFRNFANGSLLELRKQWIPWEWLLVHQPMLELFPCMPF